ncbi:MAG: RNA methyltransferase [Candidatus Dojkabacteria bacterium]|nr:RNA methyltransferase [Candidatus Dojkabacteria bacterium]
MHNKSAPSSHNPIYVILDNIRSALNVGAIFRTCDAANVEKLMLSGITAYPPHNRIPKTALGAVEYVPWQHYESTIDAIRELNNPEAQKSKNPTMKQYINVAIVSVELTKGAVNYWDYKFTGPTALIFGNEITGVSKEVLKESDAVVKVPMFGQKESLNVATTVGIVTYEATRQLIKQVNYTTSQI